MKKSRNTTKISHDAPFSSEQIHALIEGGVDILLAETSFDTLVMKACLFAIAKYFAEHNISLPVMVSGTIFENGRTLSAQTVEAFWTSVEHAQPFAAGKRPGHDLP